MTPNERTQRRWKNRPLVRERDTQRARGLWVTLALVAAALAPAGFYLFEQNKCLQLSYQIERIEKQRNRLAEIERQLAVDQASAASMQTIERWASRQRLTRPAAESVVVVPHEIIDGDTMLAGVPERTADSSRRRVE